MNNNVPTRCDDDIGIQRKRELLRLRTVNSIRYTHVETKICRGKILLGTDFTT